VARPDPRREKLMWWDVAIDVLLPTGGTRSVERAEKKDSGTISVEYQVPGAFTRRLNESGWLAEEAIAVGVLRQGKAPSLLALVSGLALMELARPRRSKSLPREFALAVTADRVVAFAMSASTEGDGTTPYVVKIKRGERGSWPRELVRLIDQSKISLSKGGTLELAGVERIPVAWDSHSSNDEVIELLSH